MHSSGTKQCFINNLKRTSVFCVNLYNLQRGLVNRMHAWVFSFPLEDERSRPRETRACVILFRIHSGNYHIISFICHLFNELQKHEWKILFLWMSVFFFGVGFFFWLQHTLQDSKTLKALCVVRLNIFSVSMFFPFLLFSKLDSQAKMYQDIEI